VIQRSDSSLLNWYESLSRDQLLGEALSFCSR